ncbi:MAG TPA: hypothetical protein VGO33_10670 [Gemmatimonadaceae bacterium]|nr:hypothetical protein [Gemmatimonadaceae bacterium]
MTGQRPISARVMFERLELKQACDDAIAEVNAKIAPAQITGWDFERYDENILEFFAVWGLVRFSVFVNTFQMLHGQAGQEKQTVIDQLMRLAPQAMADAIGRIARDAAQEHLSLLNGRVERVEARVTAIEGHANDRDEAESEARRTGKPHWIRRVRDAWNRAGSRARE